MVQPKHLLPFLKESIHTGNEPVVGGMTQKGPKSQPASQTWTKGFEPIKQDLLGPDPSPAQAQLPKFAF